MKAQINKVAAAAAMGIGLLAMANSASAQHYDQGYYGGHGSYSGHGYSGYGYDSHGYGGHGYGGHGYGGHGYGGHGYGGHGYLGHSYGGHGPYGGHSYRRNHGYF